MAWGRDAGLFAEAAILLARLPRAYAARPLPHLLEGYARDAGPRPRDAATLERIGRLTGLAAAYLPLASGFGPCLKRSLIRYAMLRRRGVPVSFHLGLRGAGPTFEGHAWVALEGRPLWEHGGLGDFRATFGYPAPELRARPAGAGPAAPRSCSPSESPPGRA